MPRVIALLCALLLAACAQATPRVASTHDDGGMLVNGMLREIALPRPLAAGARVLLEVRVGTIGSGQEVVLRTADGRLIGTVSPHSIRPGNAAGTYVVPVPPEVLAHALRDGRLHLRIAIERAGAAARPVHADEVLGVRAVVVD